MPSQEQLLLSLVQGEEGKFWSNSLQGWSADSPLPPCQWQGVTCDPASGTDVVSIDLPETDLFATLPSELGQIRSLEKLVLKQNLIHGTIPTELASLPNLEILDLSENRWLTGTIPSTFVSTHLRTLRLARNRLTGSVPNDPKSPHLASISELDLMSNALTGTLSGEVVSMMHNLETLTLSKNALSGFIPAPLGQLLYLAYLYLDKNHFVGSIPGDLARTDRSSALVDVWLQENHLSGQVPAELSDLGQLKTLYIDGNKLTGRIPEELCREEVNAEFFEGVTVDGTERDYCQSIACPVNTVAIDGIYPCTDCASAHYNPYLGREGSCIDLNQRIILEKFYKATSNDGPWTDVSNWDDEDVFLCDLSGVTCDANNHVTAISLRNRGLAGSITDEIGFLEYLEVLDLADNALTGFLPSDLRWAPLKKLDVSNNQIRGIIPPLLCSHPTNGNGVGGDYSCDRIACPAGMYSSIGRSGDGVNETCVMCGDGSPFLGKTSCEVDPSVTLGSEASSNSQGDDESAEFDVNAVVGLTFAMVVLGLAIAFFVALRMNNARFRKGEAVPQIDTDTSNAIIYNEHPDDSRNSGDGSGLRRNPAGESSLPYSGEEGHSQRRSSDPPSSAFSDPRQKSMGDSIADASILTEDLDMEALERAAAAFGDGEVERKSEKSAECPELKAAVHTLKRRGSKVMIWDVDDLESSKTNWKSSKEEWLDVPAID